MQRRQFAWLLVAFFGRAALVASPLGLLLNRAWARDRRRLLPAKTDMGLLIGEDPAAVDPRNLPITPIAQFETMGLTKHPVNPRRWRLNVAGAVTRPLSFSLDQLKALPVTQRAVLLICPGVFAYYARWHGVSVDAILKQAGISPRATQIKVSGPSGEFQKSETFPLAPARTAKLFLAYGVNGVPLPEKHGFPLRLVAEGRVGSRWVKFVDRLEAVSGTPMPPDSGEGKPSQGPAYLP
jgi:DMSO/TMAO reductase YedYZ molybdopterin-dependent catalytic subunit